MIDEHDRLEAQADEIKARQKAKEYAVPLRVLRQIRTLALSREGHAWDLIVALSEEALTALAAATGTAKTAQRVECEASQSGLKGNAQTPPGSDQ